MPTQCVVHKRSVSDSAARQRPNEEIGVLDAVVGERMIVPGLTELHSLRTDINLEALSAMHCAPLFWRDISRVYALEIP